MSAPRKRLTSEQSKVQFESQVNRAAKAIRAIAKIVEKNPTHFEQTTVNKTWIYLNEQNLAVRGDMNRALVSADLVNSPFSLDVEYPEMKNGEPVVAKISFLTGKGQPTAAELTELAARIQTDNEYNAKHSPPPGPRQKPLGRLVRGDATEKGSVVFAIDEPKAARPTPEDAAEKPDSTGGIRGFGFIED